MMMIVSTRPWSGGAYLKIGLWEALSCNILNNLNQIVDKDNNDGDEVATCLYTKNYENEKNTHIKTLFLFEISIVPEQLIHP